MFSGSTGGSYSRPAPLAQQHINKSLYLDFWPLFEGRAEEKVMRANKLL
jgi:hypothetical protein